MGDPAHAERPRSLGRLRAALQLGAVWGFAVAQPLFDITGRDPEFFVVRRLDRIDMGLLMLALLVPGPLALWAVGEVVGLLSGAARRVWHGTCLTVLVAVFVLPLLADLPLGRAAGPVALGAALALGAVAAWTVARTRPARLFLSLLAPAPLVFGLMFWMNPAVGHVTAAEDYEPAAHGKRGGAEVAETIVAVVFDELPLASLLTPDRRIDGRLFPHFARLAGDGTWFRNTTASHGFTTQALPSMLTGRAPDDPARLPILGDHPDNLFTRAAPAHRILALEPITNLCPSSLQTLDVAPRHRWQTLRQQLSDLSLVLAFRVLPESLTAGLPEISGHWLHFWAQRAAARATDELERGERRRFFALLQGRGVRAPTAEFQRFIDALDGEPVPTLAFAHVLLPHAPWVHLPTGEPIAGAASTAARDDSRWHNDRRLVDLAYRRHLFALGHADRMLGRLLARLDALGLYDGALVVVTSDHGITFEPGALRRKVRENTFDDIRRVPFLVKRPHQVAGRIDDRNVETMDVFPTLAHAAGLPVADGLDGRSALDPDVAGRPHKTIWREGRAPLVTGPEMAESWPALAARARLFGPAPDWDDVFALGAADERVGAPVDVAALDVSRRLVAALDEPGRPLVLDRGSGMLPSHVVGRVRAVSGPLHVPPLGFVVGDRLVASTGFLMPGDDARRFDAYLPAAAFDAVDSVDADGSARTSASTGATVAVDLTLVALPVDGRMVVIPWEDDGAGDLAEESAAPTARTAPTPPSRR